MWRARGGELKPICPVHGLGQIVYHSKLEMPVGIHSTKIKLPVKHKLSFDSVSVHVCICRPWQVTVSNHRSLSLDSWLYQFKAEQCVHAHRQKHTSSSSQAENKNQVQVCAAGSHVYTCTHTFYKLNQSGKHPNITKQQQWLLYIKNERRRNKPSNHMWC